MITISCTLFASGLCRLAALLYVRTRVALGARKGPLQFPLVVSVTCSHFAGDLTRLIGHGSLHSYRPVFVHVASLTSIVTSNPSNLYTPSTVSSALHYGLYCNGTSTHQNILFCIMMQTGKLDIFGRPSKVLRRLKGHRKADTGNWNCHRGN